MNKKKFILFPLLALFLTSCLFDSDDGGLSSWLSDQGMPCSYKVQTVTVDNLSPVSAETFMDTLPKNAWSRGILGAQSGMSHDAVFDFAIDSAFLARFKASDSAKSVLYLQLADSIYSPKLLPSSYFPIEEDLKLQVSWILSEKLDDREYNDLAGIPDSVWFHELESWKPQNTAETTVSISIEVKKNALTDSTLAFEMPTALVDEIRKNSGNRRLQLRLSAPEASHVYRFYGPGRYKTVFHMEGLSKENPYADYLALHAATISLSQETCSDCLVLHGGFYDSLELEFPSKPIMEALADFYGDEFPYVVDDSNDVRQAVVMAQVTFYKDDSKGENEFGYPIRVLVGSYMDLADSLERQMESYKLNKSEIVKTGHPNLVFRDGDSLSLQVTAGMRNFINKAGDGRTFKMMMRLGVPVMLEKDTLFYNRYVNNGDSLVQVFFPDFDYARYDFSSIKNKPATLKLWLASKRGEE